MSKKLTDQLREAIRESGMSGYAICKELGIQRSALSRFLNGERGLSMENLDAIGELLKLRITKTKGG